MEKKLNIGERLIILQILPKEDNFATLKLIRDLVNKIGISADEHSDFELKQNGDKIIWNEKGSEEKSIDLKNKEIEVIITALEKLDAESKLEFRHFSIFEKFKEEENDNN